MSPRDDEFNQNVFVNCPFDEDYDHILQAVLFCLVRFGLTPRIASERVDAGESRIDKIYELIQSSRYSIHDLCRCQAQRVGEYFRLNMPFELGLDFGCRHFGKGRLRDKVILVLEQEQYRYQAVISDLSGSDVESHKGDYQLAVRKVRNWLVGQQAVDAIGAGQVLSDYEDFQEWYIQRQRDLGFSDDDIRDYSTSELLNAMLVWQQEHREL